MVTTRLILDTQSLPPHRSPCPPLPDLFGVQVNGANPLLHPLSHTRGLRTNCLSCGGQLSEHVRMHNVPSPVSGVDLARPKWHTRETIPGNRARKLATIAPVFTPLVHSRLGRLRLPRTWLSRVLVVISTDVCPNHFRHLRFRARFSPPR